MSEKSITFARYYAHMRTAREINENEKSNHSYRSNLPQRGELGTGTEVYRQYQFGYGGRLE